MASPKTVSASLQDDRGTWVVRGRVYDPETGKTRQRTKSTKLKVKNNTKRKAELIKRDIIDQWTREANATPVEDSPPFTVYVNKWLDRIKESGLNANTIKSYEDYIKNQIKPQLGNIPIQQITYLDIERFYKSYLQNHKVNSAKKVNVVLSGAFREAIRAGIIHENLADRDHLDFPRAEKFKGNAYNGEQICTLLNAAKEEGEPIYSAIILATFYGLRRSEVVGLRWSDVDFSANTLTVNNTVTQNGDLRIEHEKTKTAKSNRAIALLDSTVSFLKDLRIRQETAGLKTDKVVAWMDGKEVRPDYISKKTQKLMKKCGLPVIRFHDLRHTTASLLVTKVTPKQLQDYLGHENFTTSIDIYAQLLDDQHKATSVAMNSVIEKLGIVF